MICADAAGDASARLDEKGFLSKFIGKGAFFLKYTD
jgi:hypothetical protein